jgi:hypothetical protein
MIQCVKRAILSMFVCTATKTKPKARSVEHEYQRELAEETYHDAWRENKDVEIKEERAMSVQVIIF